jgi:hypothetical protein
LTLMKQTFSGEIARGTSTSSVSRTVATIVVPLIESGRTGSNHQHHVTAARGRVAVDQVVPAIIPLAFPRLCESVEGKAPGHPRGTSAHR